MSRHSDRVLEDRLKHCVLKLEDYQAVSVYWLHCLRGYDAGTRQALHHVYTMFTVDLAMVQELLDIWNERFAELDYEFKVAMTNCSTGVYNAAAMVYNEVKDAVVPILRSLGLLPQQQPPQVDTYVDTQVATQADTYVDTQIHDWM